MESSSDQTLYNSILLTFYVIVVPTYVALQFLQAPYGKHNRPGWGPTIPAPLAWFLMESPTLWLTLYLFPSGRHAFNPKSLLLNSLYLIHYFNRTVVYPLKLLFRTPTSSFPITIALMAFSFNFLNAYVQARWVSHYMVYDENHGWLFWCRFTAGLVVFVCGMTVNIWSDEVLVGLKRSGGGYKIPRGGLFEVVSCPNYLGEIIEWFGWAVMTWSWAGLGFFLYTCANLVPRARANHKWYLGKFSEDYPKSRKAVFPFLY